jgi:hypothetical protein
LPLLARLLAINDADGQWVGDANAVKAWLHQLIDTYWIDTLVRPKCGSPDGRDHRPFGAGPPPLSFGTRNEGAEPGRDWQSENYQATVRADGRAGIPLLAHNFRPQEPVRGVQPALILPRSAPIRPCGATIAAPRRV